MKDRLRPSRFLFSLEKRFLMDYAEILSRMDKYVKGYGIKKGTYDPSTR